MNRDTVGPVRVDVQTGMVPAATAALLSIFLLIGTGVSGLAAQTFDVIHRFQGDDGQGPYGGLIEASDGALYGITAAGGAYGHGVVYKLNKNGTGFHGLHDLEEIDGDMSQGSLVEGSDGALYGTAKDGGAFGYGGVFTLNKDGTGFSTLHDFDGSDGWLPEDLLEGSDGALYGVTFYGGAPDGGVVYKLDKDGAGFLLLHEFSDIDEDGFLATGLIEGSDGALYGTTVRGGFYEGCDAGVVFKVNKDGTGYTTVHDFVCGDGIGPRGVVEGSDGALYGTTGDFFGGGHGIFKVNKDGTGFQKFYAFNGLDGILPEADLVEASDGLLYGSLQQGGRYGYGDLFRINTDGTGFRRVHDFNRADGAYPYARMIEASDGSLYGTTYVGGAGYGVVFRLALRCEASLHVPAEVHAPGSTIPVQVHLAHHRSKTVTVPWELRLFDANGQRIVRQTTQPHAFEPGDVVDRDVQFHLPEDLAAGEYTLELAISGMAGTKGATATIQVVRAE